MKRGARFLARQNGLPFYLSGRPCKRGHMSKRVSDTGTCVACKRSLEGQRVAADRAAYNRRKAKERVGKEKLLAQRAADNRKNETPAQRVVRLEKAKLAARGWRESNPSHEGAKTAKRKYKKNNPDQNRAHLAKRRAAKLQRTPKWLDANDWCIIGEFYSLAAIKTKLTGYTWEVDHVIPLQGRTVSGLHTPWNLQVITEAANQRKANKFEATA
jgi:hypothetical protein